MEGNQELVFETLESLTQITRYTFEYCDVWFFYPTKQSVESKKLLWRLFNAYAKESNYQPALSYKPPLPIPAK